MRQALYPLSHTALVSTLDHPLLPVTVPTLSSFYFSDLGLSLPFQLFSTNTGGLWLSLCGPFPSDFRLSVDNLIHWLSPSVFQAIPSSDDATDCSFCRNTSTSYPKFGPLPGPHGYHLPSFQSRSFVKSPLTCMLPAGWVLFPQDTLMIIYTVPATTGSTQQER